MTKEYQIRVFKNATEQEIQRWLKYLGNEWRLLTMDEQETFLDKGPRIILRNFDFDYYVLIAIKK